MDFSVATETRDICSARFKPEPLPFKRWSRQFVFRSSMPAMLFLLSLPVVAQAAQPAPDFNLPTRNGDFALSTLRGKVVLLDFWASWCGPCRESFPWMNQMQEKYGKSGLAIVAVNLDQNRADANQFLARIPAQFKVAFDPEGITPEQYNVMGMPTSVLLNPDGSIHSTHIGFHRDQQESYENTIAQLLTKENLQP
ncbi:MAG: TlpA family protein disulfide reductase [Pseudomonadales bacterium]|nr:TlpA family protein disulfide reductase [Pseudomonadales bacterium]